MKYSLSRSDDPRWFNSHLKQFGLCTELKTTIFHLLFNVSNAHRDKCYNCSLVAHPLCGCRAYEYQLIHKKNHPGRGKYCFSFFFSQVSNQANFHIILAEKKVARVQRKARICSKSMTECQEVIKKFLYEMSDNKIPMQVNGISWLCMFSEL